MNNGNDHHWLKIRLVGVVSNRSAIGARIRVKSLIEGQTVTQMREITAQSGYCGQNSLTAHFGLGSGTQADSIFIKWPSGQEQALGATAAGQVITIVEGQSSAVEALPANQLLHISVAPNPFTDSLNFTLETKKAIRYGRIELTDAQGKIVARKGLAPMEAGTYAFQLPAPHLPGGVYALRLMSDAGTAAAKVIKK
jgi:hypothetical protein